MGGSDDSLGDGNSGGHESGRRSGKTSNLKQKGGRAKLGPRRSTGCSFWDSKTWERRLEEHIKKLCGDKDSDPSAASHAQNTSLHCKFRQKRQDAPSIHDITSANAGDAWNVSINAQMNPQFRSVVAPSLKQHKNKLNLLDMTQMMLPLDLWLMKALFQLQLQFLSDFPFQTCYKSFMQLKPRAELWFLENQITSLPSVTHRGLRNLK
ncbi:hypothetical protein HPP92_012868 [Vanilla planifolia]|uniref:Uncharacterized protein n=1 Tax=Vanilla planifolia TaxID=51239 RepID=A0A835QWH3_VANPL|nr:hypothetical protein HPP92_012868 [Vanilla planifolia]